MKRTPQELIQKIGELYGLSGKSTMGHEGHFEAIKTKDNASISVSSSSIIPGYGVSSQYVSGSGLQGGISRNLWNKSEITDNKLDMVSDDASLVRYQLSPDSFGIAKANNDLIKGLGLHDGLSLVMDNKEVGGIDKINATGVNLNASIGRASQGRVLGNLGVSYHNEKTGLEATLGGGFGRGGMINAEIAKEFGRDSSSSRDMSIRMGLNAASILTFDVKWRHDGREFTLPLGNLLNPVSFIMRGAQSLLNLTKDREGSFYEAVNAGIKPMKAPYKELFDGEPPMLTEHGKNVMAAVKQDLQSNPDVKQVYIGQQDSKLEKSNIKQQILVEYLTEGNEALRSKITLGNPDKDVKSELIRANYANIQIENGVLFQSQSALGQGARFMGLTTLEAKAFEKQIEETEAFKKIEKNLDGDEADRLKSLISSRVAYMEGGFNSENKEQAVDTIIQIAKNTVYDKGYTLGQIVAQQSPTTMLENISKSEGFQKFCDENNITDKKDRRLLADTLYGFDSNGVKGSALELMQEAKANTLDKGFNTANMEIADRSIRNALKELSESEDPMLRAAGEAFDDASKLGKQVLIKAVYAEYMKSGELPDFKDKENLKIPETVVNSLNFAKNQPNGLEDGQLIATARAFIAGNEKSLPDYSNQQLLAVKIAEEAISIANSAMDKPSGNIPQFSLDDIAAANAKAQEARVNDPIAHAPSTLKHEMEMG